MMKVGDLVKIRRELYTLGYAIDMYGLILAIEEEKDQREEKEKMDHPMIPSIYTRTHKVTILKTNKEVPIPKGRKGKDGSSHDPIHIHENP